MYCNCTKPVLYLHRGNFLQMVLRKRIKILHIEKIDNFDWSLFHRTLYIESSIYRMPLFMSPFYNTKFYISCFFLKQLYVYVDCNKLNNIILCCKFYYNFNIHLNGYFGNYIKNLLIGKYLPWLFKKIYCIALFSYPSLYAIQWNTVL